VYGVVLVVAATVADPLAHTVYETIERGPEARRLLREAADPEPPPVPPARRAIVVLVDGLRLDESIGMGSFEALRSEGVGAIVQLPLPTVSRPFYHAMLTGVPPEGSGIRNNREGQQAVFDSLADRVRAAGGRVAWVADQLPWMAVMHGRKGDVMLHGGHATGPALDRVLAAMANPDGPTLAVVHLLAVDETAHECGVACVDHARALEETDRIVDRIAIGAPSDHIVVVLSDHGHIDPGGHGGDEAVVRTVPFVARAPGLRGRTVGHTLRVEEIAPTLAGLLGVPPPRSAIAGPVRDLVDVTPAPGAARRHSLLQRSTARASARRLSARVSWLVGVLFLSLCALGATKRAFGGFDRGSALAPAVAFVSVAFGHAAVLGRPFTMSAIDRISAHGPRLVILGAAAAVVGLAITTAVDHRREPGFAVARLRRAAAAIGWTAVTCAGLSVANVGGALGPWPVSATGHYMPVFTFATGAGACLAAAAVLLASALARSGSAEKSGVPEGSFRAPPIRSRSAADRVARRSEMPDPNELDQLAIDTVRTLSMDAVQAANSGHPGTPMALAPLGWTIFARHLVHDPKHPDWPDRDRFVLSCGHASMLQYSLLHLAGYDLSLDEIRRFRQWGSLTPGHPEARHTPGVETTTGPLGQGFANAVGMAMAERHLAKRFNRDGHALFDHRTWVFASDGDIMEGVAAEAASLAGHLRLNKLVVFYDDNRITIDGRTELTFSEDVEKRFEAYGWNTLSVEDGNDVAALEAAAAQAKESDRPTLVRVRTVIAWPAPNMRDTSAAHGAPLGEEEIAATKKLMGWPDEKFRVPTDLRRATDGILARGAEAYASWQTRLAAYREAHPALAKELDDALAARLPVGWDAEMPDFAADAKGLATRKASGQIIAAIAPKLGGLVGGSADLAGSNNTVQKGLPEFQDHETDGPPRNVHWGIREHAMGSCINGMALHGGVIPYGATFLVFSDYMRPAIRLACLMNIPTRYVFTHDSIGLGEDGPTHQPVEQIAALRAIPNMTVLRPADANEVRELWRVMLERRGPAALVLTRQNVPTLDRGTHASAAGAGRGAYVLADASADPAVVLIGTGSEVHVALAARDQLEKDGVPTRVVSMPSWELFAEQDAAYRDSVLPPAVSARVVVEAGVRMGWERWAGARGGYVTLDRFGASAPSDVLYERLGITPAAVVAEARRVLG
jgi:transketolase